MLTTTGSGEGVHHQKSLVRRIDGPARVFGSKREFEKTLDFRLCEMQLPGTPPNKDGTPAQRRGYLNCRDSRDMKYLVGYDCNSCGVVESGVEEGSPVGPLRTPFRDGVGSGMQYLCEVCENPIGKQYEQFR